MLFNSLQFAVFFIPSFFLYYFLPANCCIGFLVLVSYLYYASWSVEYTLLLFFITVVTYLAARTINSAKTKKWPANSLISGIILAMSTLFFFKYYNFFATSFNTILSGSSSSVGLPILNIVLPVGISFFIFKAVSYMIDVYRGKVVSEQSVMNYALYISFFPQLLAGPIERATHLLPQFKQRKEFDYALVSSGLRLFAWGLFKKVVIADRVSLAVDRVYNAPGQFEGIHLCIATLLFTYQIYCDFSGYSDMAIGLANMLGFRCKPNFARPYFSSSVAEFWQKWHISLTSWFKDYVYIPLGGNRVAPWHWSLNIMVVFLVSGLWHGANWTFIVWGALHGIYLLVEKKSLKVRLYTYSIFRLNKFPIFLKIIKVTVVFCLVSYGWIFFRANSIEDAFYISTHLFSGLPELFFNFNFVDFTSAIGLLGIGREELIIAFLSILLLESVQLAQSIPGMEEKIFKRSVLIRWPLYYFLIFIIIFYGSFNIAQNFIYMQF